MVAFNSGTSLPSATVVLCGSLLATARSKLSIIHQVDTIVGVHIEPSSRPTHTSSRCTDRKFCARLASQQLSPTRSTQSIPAFVPPQAHFAFPNYIASGNRLPPRKSCASHHLRSNAFAAVSSASLASLSYFNKLTASVRAALWSARNFITR
jgi:hypothetical protein